MTYLMDWVLLACLAVETSFDQVTEAGQEGDQLDHFQTVGGIQV